MPLPAADPETFVGVVVQLNVAPVGVDVSAIPVVAPLQRLTGLGAAVTEGPGLTVIATELVTCCPHASVVVAYKVWLPAVGKVMLALLPVPADGVPVGLRLQLYVYGGTPYDPAVDALMLCPWHTLVEETVIGLVGLVCSNVLPTSVIVQGDAAPIHVLLHPPEL